MRQRLACLLLFCLSAASAGEPPADAGIVVNVEVHGDTVIVDADVDFAAPRPQVWAVLTDFDHLPQFVSNIRASKVLSRDGNLVRVAQTGVAHFGVLAFEFKSIRELILDPPAGFASRQVEGNMKRFAGRTALEPRADGTHLHYHAEAVPESLLPPGMARSMIAAETREHYREIRNEVMRRLPRSAS